MQLSSISDVDSLHTRPLERPTRELSRLLMEKSTARRLGDVIVLTSSVTSLSAPAAAVLEAMTTDVCVFHQQFIVSELRITCDPINVVHASPDRRQEIVDVAAREKPISGDVRACWAAHVTPLDASYLQCLPTWRLCGITMITINYSAIAPTPLNCRQFAGIL